MTFVEKLKFNVNTVSNSAGAQKQIVKLKRAESEAVKVIEELVTKGLITEEYAKESGTALKAAIKHTTEAAITVAKCFKIQLNAMKTINTFLSEFKMVTSYRVLFESPEMDKALQRIVSIDEYDQNSNSDDYTFIEI